jgi:hypothetical protein
VAAVSASVSAVSAWNSHRSAKASQKALEETRQQRRIDDTRFRIGLLGTLYDDSMAVVASLGRDLRSDPANVERRKDVLRRSSMVAGIETPAMNRLLLATEPLTAAEVDQMRSELTARSAAFHELLTVQGDSAARLQRSTR